MTRYEELGFTYRVVRSKRRTVSIVVTTTGEVIIRAPQRLAIDAIRHLVHEKRAWILGKLQQFEEQRKQLPPQQPFGSGKKILWKGQAYPVDVHPHEKKRIVIELREGEFHVSINEQLDAKEKEQVIRKKMMEWYKNEALEFISQRINQLKGLLMVNPVKITIRNQKTKWGSCTSKGTLNFNWRLLMAPVPVIDYVIVHELCHLREKSHSKRFWALVASIMQDYKEKKQWLKTNGSRLRF